MKILILPNPIALAHVTRPLEVAKSLRQRGHEILFAGQGSYMAIPKREGFAVEELECSSVSQVMEAVRSGKLSKLYPQSLLERWVDAELALYRRWRPDVVLADCRVTATTSTEIAGIPCVTTVNTHMTRFREIPFTDLRGMGLVPKGWEKTRRWLERRMNGLEMWGFSRILLGGLHALRRDRGLADRTGIRLEEGNLTLLADSPDFNPSVPLPAHVHFVGPLIWQIGGPAPRCLVEKKVDPSRPLVYISINSQVIQDLVSRLDPLTKKGIQFLVATGTPVAREQPLPDGVFLEEFVDADWIYGRRGNARKADLTVCYGGNGTIYQALRAGVPVVGFATHAEQYYGLKRINELGLGHGYHWRDLEKSRFELLTRSVLETLNDTDGVARVKTFAQRLAPWAEGPRRAADHIERFMAGSHREETSAVQDPALQSTGTR